jgi:hypothetical protein
MSTGLMGDTSLPTPPAFAQPTATDPSIVPHAYGMVPMESMAQIMARERAAATTANNSPIVQGLAAHVRTCWSAAWNAKRTTQVEERLLKAMNQRRGVYDSNVLGDIRKMGGSEIYMMLTSNKCRSAASWIRDVTLGTAKDKPWTISPTPLPEMPPGIMQAIQQMSQMEVQQTAQATGQQPTPQDQERIMQYVKDRVIANARSRSQEMCERMETKMEDQLAEGGFSAAFSGFIEDLVTFPSAFMKGPVVRNKPSMAWAPNQQGGYDLQVADKLTLEWERVDPFMAYPAPHSTGIEDGYFIERHRLTRGQLNQLIGVEGYSDVAIKAVLDEHGRGGLHEWLYIDSAKALAEGKSNAMIMSNPEVTIDAIQYWGSVQGKMLIEWGMDEQSVPEPTKEYNCEVWLIGSWVIKSTLNPDPLGRKPYFKTSYEEIPGVFWGNGVTDLCEDVQTQCNVAARAIANNMGIASGPQTQVNVDRLPNGEDITQMYPWKIWQTTSDPYGSSAAPISFFAPPMISGELMQIYTFFSGLADEHTGIPRYMSGDATGSGALRTSSGMSMLMNNAGKAIKHVIANVDQNVLQPLIERLYFYNMRYGDDPDLKGDVQVIARGANSLIVKENQQQRMNEFLQLALTNPVVNQIVGEEAIAAILRQTAKQLDMDTDKLVPPAEVIRARVFQQQQAAAAAQKAQQDFQMKMSLAPAQEVTVERGPNGEMLGMTVLDKQQHMMGQGVPMGGMPPPGGGSGPQTMSSSGQTTGGQPITDNFSPMRSGA